MTTTIETVTAAGNRSFNGNNQPPVLQRARNAFNLIDTAETFKGAAQHGMAWVIRTLHAEYMANGTMSIAPIADKQDELRCPSWDEIRQNKTTRADFLKAVKVSLNIANLPASKDETVAQYQKRIEHNRREARHNTLVSNSLDFAIALAHRNVSMDAYSEVKEGRMLLPVWSVPLGMLMRDDWGVKGMHLDGTGLFNKGTIYQLNGRALPLLKPNKDRTDYVNAGVVASIAHFKDCAFPEMTQATKSQTGANETDTTNGAPPVIIGGKTWRAGDFDAFILHAAAIANSWHDPKDAKNGLHPVKFSDFSESVRNALEGLAMFVDECKANEAVARDIAGNDDATQAA